jgi:hypothetical protein
MILADIRCVIGRAAAIAADKQSFDLHDDSEGLGVSKILTDPQYLKKFGYGPAAEAPKKTEEPKEEAKEAEASVKTATEPAQTNGLAEAPVEAAKETVPTNENSEASVVEAPEVSKETGAVPEKHKAVTETLLKATDGEIPQAIPAEVVNAA